MSWGDTGTRSGERCVQHLAPQRVCAERCCPERVGRTDAGIPATTSYTEALASTRKRCLLRGKSILTSTLPVPCPHPFLLGPSCWLLGSLSWLIKIANKTL